ncbi:hypothetical protein E2C01_058677 [Portunus trituberculatus]|uniref:Uncharacterized protein n=1 Tax=Portunus trituberculatus TaxID=210409 RepID=A0A5B7H3P5_PORTR|nr:hypothetical protein [Portunus trituberculatus]
MWWVQQALVWLALGAAFTAALNYFLMSRNPSPATILLHPKSPSSSALENHSLHQQVYLRGEVYALRNRRCSLGNSQPSNTAMFDPKFE